MKKLLIATAATLFATGFATAQEMDHGAHHGKNHEHDAQHHDHDGDKTAEADTTLEAVAGRTIEVEVNGMVCDFCAQSLKKVLRKNDAVEDVAIDLDTKRVTIITAEDATLSDEDVEKAVKHAGYTPVGITRS